MENQIQLRQNSAVIIRQQGTTFSLNDLGEELKNLKSDELRIIKARETGCAISDLNKQEYEAALTGIIFNVAAMCGCQLPTHEAHVNALEKEFTIFLKDYGYDNLTPEEILTAFRMNINFQLRDKIEIYGALFNIDFAAKVLSQYRNQRWTLDNNLLGMYHRKQNDKVFSEEAMRRRNRTKEQFELYLKDENAELDLTDCYMQLVEDGAFYNPRQSELFLQEARQEVRINDTSKLGELLRTKAGINLEANFLAEKMAVRYLFDQMKKSNRLIIYDDDYKLVHKGFEMPEKVTADADDLPF